MKPAHFLIGLLYFSSPILLFSQTMPIPFNLASGNFHFTSWDSLSAAGSYPAGMVFQFVPSNHSAPFYDDSAIDYSCPYNLSKRPRINGYMAKGIGFVSTSNSQYNDCVSGASDDRFMGSALLSLNSTARQNLKVTWKSETLIPGDGNGVPSNPRVWRLRLQYRVGESGNFTDVPGPVEFVSGLNSGDSISFGPTSLPMECSGKPVVQLRWIYYESAAGNAGTRPRLRLDDIIVTSESQVGIQELTGPEFSIYPNPVSSNFTIVCKTSYSGEILIRNQQGQVVIIDEIEDMDEQVDCSALTPGLYLLQFTEARNSKVHSLRFLKR